MENINIPTAIECPPIDKLVLLPHGFMSAWWTEMDEHMIERVETALLIRRADNLQRNATS